MRGHRGNDFISRREPAARARADAFTHASGPDAFAHAVRTGTRDEEEQNPFAPEPAPVLQPGMKGSDTNDPRAKLASGMYNAGEATMGIKHLQLIKKPAAFQLGTDNPDDPKVQKMLGQLNSPNLGKIPAQMRLEIAQLAFANSDLAFKGKPSVPGKFLWREHL